MSRELNTPFGETVKVTRHVVLDNGWQYFLTDCDNSRPKYSKAIVDKPDEGCKPQYGYVYLGGLRARTSTALMMYQFTVMSGRSRNKSTLPPVEHLSPQLRLGWQVFF